MRRTTLPALLLAACGLPTGPTQDLSPAGRFTVSGGTVTAPMRADADALWDLVGACVAGGKGRAPSAPEAFPIRVVTDYIDCGGVTASGCYQSDNIRVQSVYYHAALQHELTNYAFDHLGLKTDAERDETFRTCSGDSKCNPPGAQPPHLCL